MTKFLEDIKQQWEMEHSFSAEKWEKLFCELEKSEQLEAENRILGDWVNDLQAGMYINCVYCGHRYGPDDEVPAAMSDVLKEHIERCPKHPLAILRKAVEDAGFVFNNKDIPNYIFEEAKFLERKQQ